MTEMKRARQIAAMLSAGAAPAAPSAKLRRRILAAAGEEQKSYGLAPWFAVAAMLMLIAAAYFSGRERSVEKEMANLRVQMGQQDIQLTRLNEAMTIMNGRNTREVTFGTGTRGKVFVNPSTGVLLMASNLPQAPAGKTYEMWIIPKGGKPAPAGIFQAQPDGTAMHIQAGPVDANAVVAVTLENEGGAEQPTSQPLIVAAPQ